ncbi:5-enolpyruvylshikimate-3-phosphate synthetase [Burkholderiales bacterium]|nr:5-enolpyruvylshikimate-3-phosphate synthetase [Burkholderiales bacterium]
MAVGANTMPDKNPPRTWPPVLTVEPIARAQGEVRLPGSKSMSNRALLLAALAEGSTQLSGLLEADDTRVMIRALRALGVAIAVDGDQATVHGCGGRFPVRRAELHLGNAGTAMRPLTAVLALAGGHYRLDGVARMRERPIGDLVDALVAMGARIDYLGAPGYPPLLIEPPRTTEGERAGAPGQAARPAPADAGRVVQVRGGVSSQFLSGLLMAAPVQAPEGGLRFVVEGELISQPYVAMTVAMMRAFGARAHQSGSTYVVEPHRYRAPGTYAIEGDASGASYFLALGAIAGGPVLVRGVGRDSLQGDLAFTQVLQAMGARIEMGADWVQASAGSRGGAAQRDRAGGPGDRRPRLLPLQAVDIDASAIPDAAMTAAVLALFAEGTTRLRGIGSWRVKETDRIHAMATELHKLGATVQSGPDWIAVTPPRQGLCEALIDTYDDHRMAMCFSLVAAGAVRVHIREPGCVAKTFPDYFEQLERLRAPGRR